MNIVNKELTKQLARAVEIAEEQQVRLRKCEVLMGKFNELLDCQFHELEMYRELVDELERNNKDLSINAKYLEYYGNYKIQDKLKIQCECFETIFKISDELSKPMGESNE